MVTAVWGCCHIACRDCWCWCLYFSCADGAPVPVERSSPLPLGVASSLWYGSPVSTGFQEFRDTATARLVPPCGLGWWVLHKKGSRADHDGCHI